jgi:hypothetical protein
MSNASPEITQEPMLIVGLGGAGGQTVARLKNIVEQSGAEIPPTMHFLYLDTDNFDALDPSVRRVLDRHQDFLNISNFNPREWIEAQFNSQGPAADDVRDWYDTSARSFIPYEHIKDGASRLRLLGRICLFKHRFEVEERIKSKISACLSGASQLDQQRPLEGGPRPLKILIISGTCGGTGSGTFLDVLYMLNRAAVVDFHLAPQTIAFLYLPDLFIRLNQRISEMNVPLYQANGWAFLDELDYFIKHPSQMNEYALDSRSADRRPHPVGTGIPAGVDLVHTAFLIDAKIPNVGILENPRDLYAYAARGIFQSQLVPTAGSIASFFSNVKNYLLERDAQRSRPKRYAAMGYAELRYPRNVFSSYLGLRYMHDLIGEGLLSERREVLASAKDDASAWVRAILGELIQPSMAELSKAKQRAIDNLPTEASFETRDQPPKIDGERISEAALRAEVEDALRSLDRTVSTLHIRFAAERARIAGELSKEIARRIDTAADGRGLPYLRDLLAATDRALEGELSQLMARSPEGADLRFEEAKSALLAAGGVVDQLVKTGRSFFGRDRAVRARLPAFLGALRSMVETRVEGELVRCRVQLLKAICGDPEDRDPVVETYDEKTGAVIASRVERSLLDRAEDKVIAAINVHLSTLVDVLRVDQLGGKLFKTEGQELTTRYVVAASSMEELASNAFLDRLFEEHAHLGPKDVAQEVDGVLRETAGKGLRLSDLGGATYEEERLRPLIEVLEARSKVRIGENVDKSVIEVVAGFAEEQREKLLTDLAHASTPAITINDGVLDPVADQLIRIRVVSCEKPEHAAYLKNESFTVVPGTRDRFSAQQLYFAFPLYAVRGVLSLQQAYLNRDRQRNFPHIHRRFNERGLPETLGQESFAVSDAALLTFARARAVSEHVLQKEAVLAPLAKFMELERERFGEGARAVALIDYEKRDGAWVLSMNLIDQDPERRIRFRVHSPLELGAADLRSNLTTYAKSAAYLQNHARFVDSMEILESEIGGRFVADAYAAYISQIEREIAEARAKKEDARVRVLLAMGRLLDAHTHALERDRASLEPL